MKRLNGKLPNNPFQVFILSLVEVRLKTVFSTLKELLKVVGLSKAVTLEPLKPDKGVSTGAALVRLPRF